MPHRLHLQAGTREDGTAVIVVSGEIDLRNCDFLRQELDDVAGRVEVDLRAVDYVDSATLSVLFAHADRLDIVITPLLEPVFAITGLDTVASVRVMPASPRDHAV